MVDLKELPKRVLVIGGTGMAGHMIADYLRESGHHVMASSRIAGHGTQLVLDPTDDRELEKGLVGDGFDVVINCVGTLVSTSESEPDVAIRTNSYLPHRLAALTRHTNTRLIHLSTDCVFSGTTGPYSENSFRDGDSIYDRSKALGEVINAKDLTLRMSIIGPEVRRGGTGLLHWLLGQTGDVLGFRNAIWNGITTLELARIIEIVIRAKEPLVGLYHAVPEYSISKYNLLIDTADAFGRPDLRIISDDRPGLDKTLIDTRNELPTEVGAGGYKQMLDDLAAWVEAHPRRYEGDDRYVVTRHG